MGRSVHTTHDSTCDSEDFHCDMSELLSWMLFVSRFVSRDMLEEYLPLIISFIPLHLEDHIVQSRLCAEACMLAFLDYNQAGRTAHPQVLQSILTSSQITTYFSDMNSAQSTSISNGLVNASNSFLRERLVASCCRGITQIIPTVLAYVTSSHNYVKLVTIQTPGMVTQKPYAGLGIYAERYGASLRSTVEGSIDESSPTVCTEVALLDLDNIVAAALLVIRVSSK